MPLNSSRPDAGLCLALRSILPSLRSIIRLLACAALTAAVTATIASAQAPVTKTWTGGAGDGKWETGGNWSPAGAPAKSDSVVIPGNSGVITTNGGNKRVGTIRLEPSTNGPPPPTVLTSNDPFALTSDITVTATGFIYVGKGSTIRGEDPTQPNQPGGGCTLTTGGPIIIDGEVEGGDASSGSLTRNPGGRVKVTGGKIGTINFGGVRGGTGSTHTGGLQGGTGGPVDVKGDPIPGTGTIRTTGGTGGTGNPPGKKGTVHINGELQARLVSPGIVTGDSITFEVGGAGADIDLHSLPGGAITADDHVAILSTGTIDLRGNPAGVSVIQAGGSIRMCGVVLLDPGVSLADITSPDAIIDCGGVLDVPSGRDSGLALGRPMPNPARGAVTIPFSLPREMTVRLVLHDLRGARVRTLREGRLPAGPHQARWDGLDDSGQPVGAGVLFLKLDSTAGTRTGTLLRLR